jgi:hypothetical protein
MIYSCWAISLILSHVWRFPYHYHTDCQPVVNIQWAQLWITVWTTAKVMAVDLSVRGAFCSVYKPHSLTGPKSCNGKASLYMITMTTTLHQRRPPQRLHDPPSMGVCVLMYGSATTTTTPSNPSLPHSRTCDSNNFLVTSRLQKLQSPERVS